MKVTITNVDLERARRSTKREFARQGFGNEIENEDVFITLLEQTARRLKKALREEGIKVAIPTQITK